MLVKASCLLILATTALARRHHVQTTPNYAETTAPVPIDYNDELTIQNPMVRPGNNLVFSFEQTRRDQPPLVDIREEDIGKYLGRRRTTTTTTTTTTTPAPTTTTPLPSSASDSEESSEEINYEVPVQHQPIIVPQQPLPSHHQNFASPSRHPIMLATGTTAVPVFRAFHDFSEPIDLPDSSRIDPKARFPDVDKWPHVAMGTPPSPPAPKWDEFQDLQKGHSISPNFYQPQSTEHVPIQTSWTQTPQRKPHRGNRRHQKPYIANVPASTVTPTIAPYKAPVPPTVGARGVPPPVPTLTPWAGDNF